MRKLHQALQGYSESGEMVRPHNNQMRAIGALLVLLVQLGVSDRVRGQFSQPLLIPDGNDFPLADASSAAGLTIAIREDLLSAVVSQETVQSDDVVTRVMEADVRGVQSTKTAIRLQCVESPEVARLLILATGNVDSNTVGFTPQARVTTLGQHTFDIRKPVFFDGSQFSTKPAYGKLQARQFPQSVNTVASRMPLLGPIGNRIAWKEVYRRMPTSNSIVVRKLADEVLPKVNAGIDKQLCEINRDWRRLRARLNATFRRDPISWSSRTSEDSLEIRARNAAVQLPESRPLSASLATPECGVVLLAESAVNKWLDLQPIGGLTISDATLQNLVTAIRGNENDPTAILQALRNVADGSAAPTVFSIRLADHRPISLAFDRGEMIVRLKFQLLPKTGATSAMQVVTAVVKGQDSDDGLWSVVLQQLNVAPENPDDLPDSWAALINSQARQIVERIPPTDLPRRIDAGRLHERLPLLNLHRIQTESGWLRFSVRMDDQARQMTRRSQSPRP